MKNLIIAAIAATTFASCNNAEKTTEEETTTVETTTPPTENAVGLDTAASDMNKPAAQATEKKVIYTCTMHPEVQMDKPGKCPKCGMTLVVKK